MNFLVNDINDLGPIDGNPNNFNYVVSQGIRFYPETYYGYNYRYEASLLIPTQDVVNWIEDFKRTPTKTGDDFTLYNLYNLKINQSKQARFLRVFRTSLEFINNHQWFLYPINNESNFRIGNELLLDDEIDSGTKYTRFINYYKQITWNDFIDIIDNTRRNYEGYAS